MTALALRPDTTAVLARVDAVSGELTAIVDVLPLVTTEDETRARELLTGVARLRKEAEEARKAEKAPHLTAGQEIDRLFKSRTAELERVDAVLRRRVGESVLAREEARRRAVEAARLAAVAGDAEGANAAIVVAGRVADAAPVAQTANGSISERFTYELDSVGNLHQVPTRFLALDMTAIRAEIAAATRAGRAPEIPGLTFRRVAALTVRT